MKINTLPIGKAGSSLCADSHTDSLINKRYRIIEVLGEGGFGRTFLCKDEVLDVYVAVKAINRENFTSQSAYLTEARVSADLRQRKEIVSALDCFCEEKTAYIVMEYVDGMNLFDYCRANPMSQRKFFELLEPVFIAVGFMHDKGFLHRDISPGNIVIGKDGAKLIDFGAAINYKGNTKYCKAHVVKPGFSPPEQFEKFKDFLPGPWSDVYALAATILNVTENIKLTHGVRCVLKKAIRREPEKRYQSMSEFNNALQYEINKKPVVCEKSVRFFLAVCALISNIAAYEKINMASGISLFDNTPVIEFINWEGM